MPVFNKHKNPPADAIYIGRGSAYGNPFVMGQHGDRQTVVKLFSDLLDKNLAEGKIHPDQIKALHGKNLVCFCAPLACHGDVLLAKAKELMEQSMNEFKLIVAGGRDFNDRHTMWNELLRLSETEYKTRAISIVNGMARGADLLGREFAVTNNVKFYDMPADWGKYGKAAGFRRNGDMALFADGLLAFWDGQSKGTAHMIETMQKMNKPTHVVMY